MKYVLMLVVALLCACSKSVYTPENSYALRVHELTIHGLDALHHGRFSSAENSLQRALHSAWLSADPVWIGRSQYYLGALFLALDKPRKSMKILIKAKKNAALARDQDTSWRTMFAIALLQQQAGQAIADTPALQQDMPADVYLSAARLAHLQQRYAGAKQAYLHVLSLPVIHAEAVYARGQTLLGLALLARDQQHTVQALSWSEQGLQLSQQAGLPVLAAHTLLLQGELKQDAGKYVRALAMYQALEDEIGQKAALKALLKLSPSASDEKAWQKILKRLGK